MAIARKIVFTVWAEQDDLLGLQAALLARGLTHRMCDGRSPFVYRPLRCQASRM
jgi:hypothetical protein